MTADLTARIAQALSDEVMQRARLAAVRAVHVAPAPTSIDEHPGAVWKEAFRSALVPVIARLIAEETASLELALGQMTSSHNTNVATTLAVNKENIRLREETASLTAELQEAIDQRDAVARGRDGERIFNFDGLLAAIHEAVRQEIARWSGQLAVDSRRLVANIEARAQRAEQDRDEALQEIGRLMAKMETMIDAE